MIPNKQRQWFTLIELIVVITILAILGTIAFIALQGYSKTARDSARISDMSRIKSSLELYMVEWGKYPEPTNITDVTYSGTLAAWHQGSFWESTFRNVERLDKIPLDPTTDKKYTYSVTNSRKEFQLGWILETTDFALTPPNLPLSGEGQYSNLQLSNQANAWDTLATARIIWSYNGQILKVLKWNDLTILASPSIICSIDGLTVQECISQNKLAYNGFKNLPPSFEGTQYKQLWEEWSLTLVNNTAEIVVYNWKKTDLVEDSTDWQAARKAMVEKLQAAYSSTKIADREWIRKLVNVDTTDDTAIENLWASIVNNKINSGMITASKLSVENNTSWNTVTVESISSITTKWIKLVATSFIDLNRMTLFDFSLYGESWNSLLNNIESFNSTDYQRSSTLMDYAVDWSDTTHFKEWVNSTGESFFTINLDSIYNISKIRILQWGFWMDYQNYQWFDGFDIYYMDESSNWILLDSYTYDTVLDEEKILTFSTPTFSDCTATTLDWYSIPAMTHATNGDVTRTVSLTNWTETFTNNYACDDGLVFATWTETSSVTCTGWYTWTSCEIAPVTDWRAQDPNCDIADIVIWDQTWAGCNSTLWTWVDYVPWECYDYQWNNTWTNCWWSTTKESDYNSTYWLNTIWWKLYTWDNAQNACWVWYHLSSIEEITQAMVDLWCIDTVSSTTTWRQCAWLWWWSEWWLLSTLKIPLTGNNRTDWTDHGRWLNWFLWSSTDDWGNGRGVFYSYDETRIERWSLAKWYYFPVRCIKDPTE